MTETLARMTPQQCPEGVHADWAVDSEDAHACPWCLIADLNASLQHAAETVSGQQRHIRKLEADNKRLTDNLNIAVAQMGALTRGH